MSQKSIIIVDDEAIIAQTLETLLEIKTGYDVKVFTQAQAALAYIREHPLDLLLTDYFMPGINGLELLRQARQSRPDLPVIVLTGYYHSGEMDQLAAADPKIAIMLKPWNSAALIEKIHIMLGEPKDKPQE